MDYCNSVESTNYLSSANLICLIKPFLPIHVLLHGSEIWGFKNIDIIERVHLRFCKLILQLKKSTPNFMVYGELGGYPISVIMKVRMIRFWHIEY